MLVLRHTSYHDTHLHTLTIKLLA